MSNKVMYFASLSKPAFSSNKILIYHFSFSSPHIVIAKKWKMAWIIKEEILEIEIICLVLLT